MAHCPAIAEPRLLHMPPRQKTRAHARTFFSEKTRLMLLPVEIKVNIKGRNRALTDRLLAKKGDTLQFQLSDIPQEQFPLPIDKIVWYYQQMKPDGTYADWTLFGDTGKGVKFESVMQTAGIFQIKAVLQGSTDVFYLRKYDEIWVTSGHIVNDGIYGPGRKGQPNAIGVADTQVQIDAAYKAAYYLGSDTYSMDYDTPAKDGFSAVLAGKWKCNIFLAHQETEAGAIVPAINGLRHSNPPTANQWAGTEDTCHIPLLFSTNIVGWSDPFSTPMPQPGWVVAHPDTTGDVASRHGHCGIIDYDGIGIGAGESGTVNKLYLPFNDGTSNGRKYQP